MGAVLTENGAHEALERLGRDDWAEMFSERMSRGDAEADLSVSHGSGTGMYMWSVKSPSLDWFGYEPSMERAVSVARLVYNDYAGGE